MSTTKLDDVFKISGVPNHTFVYPKKYPDLLLNLQSPGKCLVIEGPSGIGKTTAIIKALEEAAHDRNIVTLSARRPSDIEYIKLLPELDEAGTILVDDFHKLSIDTKDRLADHLKVLADNQESSTKIIILGINKAGDSLINFAPDLVNRVDIITFEVEPDDKIRDLIAKGENSLNIEINVTEEIVKAANGSLYLAQMLSREVCLRAGITDYQENGARTEVSFELIVAGVWERLSMAYRQRTAEFCKHKLRRKGVHLICIY